MAYMCVRYGMAGYPHPQNLICKNLDLTASREIYMLRKFPGIRYNMVNVLLSIILAKHFLSCWHLMHLAIYYAQA